MIAWKLNKLKPELRNVFAVMEEDETRIFYENELIMTFTRRMNNNEIESEIIKYNRNKKINRIYENT